MSETRTGPNANTVTTTEAFLTVTQVSQTLLLEPTLSGFCWLHQQQTGIVFAGATRVRGMHGVSNASTAGAMIIRNGLIREIKD